VVTPLAVDLPGEPAIPVVRGWTPSPESAPAPPAPPVPEGAVELVGWLQPPEGTGEADPYPSDDVLPQLRIADLVQHVDQDLYGAYAVVADQVAPGDWPVGEDAVNPGTDGLEQASLEQLPDAGRFTALRNLLYAVEWWVFGFFAAFIWWRYVQDARAAEAPAVDPVPSDA
jgi:cytochrome oxidase assembly protein ShyY1